MRAPAALLLLLPLLGGCVAPFPGLAGPEPEARQTTRTRVVDAAPDVVWFEMERVLRTLRIPIAHAEPGMDDARLVSDPFNISPDDVRCAVRPSGESPLGRSAMARLRVELGRSGPSRTEVTFHTEVLGTAVEPDLRADVDACRSRGTLEERILALTARRLRGA